MVLARYGLPNLTKPVNKLVLKLSSTVSQLFEDVAFLIIGLSLFGLDHKFDKIDAYVVVQNFFFLFLSRFISVMLVSGIITVLKIKRIGGNFQSVLCLSGIRGAMCRLTSLRPGHRESWPLPRGRVPDPIDSDHHSVDLRLRPSNALHRPPLQGQSAVDLSGTPISTSTTPTSSSMLFSMDSKKEFTSFLLRKHRSFCHNKSKVIKKS